jgi:kinesin family member C1
VLEANLSFPDPLDHKEIMVSSLSESATGKERKEVCNFVFDTVSIGRSESRSDVRAV